MIHLDPILPTYAQDVAANVTWARLQALMDTEGAAFYKHPNLGMQAETLFPEFVILTRDFAPLIVRCLAETPSEFKSIYANGDVILIELEDMIEGLRQRLNRDRNIRHLYNPIGILAIPHFSKSDCETLFPNTLDRDILILGADQDPSFMLPKLEQPVTTEQYHRALSILQTANGLGRGFQSSTKQQADKMGAAIRELENAIVLLDTEQQKAALNIPPGPQCIRGLAGTGKTVLLAMKAASIHSHFPTQRILFTFNTQSLYKVVRGLITRFYRVNHYDDPNWDVLHVRHGWGGARRDGVYSDICQRHGRDALTLRDARSIDREEPFRACCKSAIESGISPFYDFILVDEAQDFPPEFFHLLWLLSKEPHCVYYAYDELQSLSTLEMPSPRDLFGQNQDGSDRFVVEGEYPGGIEKILTLTKSYRCPLEILMLAHALGLGIHSPRGPVQMLCDPSSWRALGYDPGASIMETDSPVDIVRPIENSPNIVSQMYTGQRAQVIVRQFVDREQEFDAVAESIANDIYKEGVLPHNIVVISLDNMRAKAHMSQLQSRLHDYEIPSMIPGLVDDASEFAEEGYVTLSTVYRAKGNEAPLIYIISFETLLEYVDELNHRNRAFTSISRSKGWVWISGIGTNMTRIRGEISTILKDIPHLKFKFPDMATVQRRLDPSETTRRRTQVSQARRSIHVLEAIDVDALASLDSAELDILAAKLRAAQEARGEAE